MGEIDNKAVAERLRFLAQLVGGPSAFSRLTGMSRTTTFDYLNEIRPLPPVRLHLISARFPCSLDWLLEGVGAPPGPDPKRTLAANKPASNQSDEGLSRKPAKTRPTSWRMKHATLTSSVGAASEVRLTVAGERVRELLNLATPEKLEKIKGVLGFELLEMVVSGRAVPDLPVLVELAVAADVKTSWLLGLGE